MQDQPHRSAGGSFRRPGHTPPSRRTPGL